MLNKFKDIKNYHIADDIVYNLNLNLEKKQSCGLGISVYRNLKPNECNYLNYSALAM